MSPNVYRILGELERRVSQSKANNFIQNMLIIIRENTFGKFNLLSIGNCCWRDGLPNKREAYSRSHFVSRRLGSTSSKDFRAIVS